jgi:hypothetical protein
VRLAGAVRAMSCESLAKDMQEAFRSCERLAGGLQELDWTQSGLTL